MSKGPENTFIGSVHRHLPDDGPYHMKTYNPMTGGTPDMYYSGKKADLWVEYKFIHLPVKDTTVINLIIPSPKTDSEISALQQDWLMGRHSEGRNVAVVVGSKNGGVLLMGDSWNTTYSKAQYTEWMMDRKSLARKIAEFCG